MEVGTPSDLRADNNSMPNDLRNALSKNKKALENFPAFPPCYRKRFLFWIDSAKTPETKAARIKQTHLMVSLLINPIRKDSNCEQILLPFIKK